MRIAQVSLMLAKCHAKKFIASTVPIIYLMCREYLAKPSLPNKNLEFPYATASGRPLACFFRTLQYTDSTNAKRDG